MARFSSNYKRAFLRNLYAAKDESAQTLTQILLSTLRGKIDSTAEGFTVSSVSGAGHSTSFWIPQSGAALTPQTLAELCDELITIYEDCARFTNSSEDEVVYQEMLSRLAPVRRTRGDFSGMGCYA